MFLPCLQTTIAVRRRTGGRRRRWVVLWPAAAARRAFFVGGGGVGLWSAAAAAWDRMREHWNSALAGQAFFWFYRGQPLHMWSPLGRWRRKINCEYVCFAQFHSQRDVNTSQKRRRRRRRHSVGGGGGGGGAPINYDRRRRRQQNVGGAAASAHSSTNDPSISIWRALFHRFCNFAIYIYTAGIGSLVCLVKLATEVTKLSTYTYILVSYISAFSSH